MSDRIPIGTVPGLASQLVNEDVLIGALGVAATVSRIFLRHTDYDDSGATDTAVTGTIRNATGGGGEGISFTIVDQTQGITATGTLSLAAGDSIYLRVTVAGISQNLTGWIEATSAAGVTTALTSLARVKQSLGISVADDDDLLNTLIAGVSAEVQKWLKRQIVQATATDERISVPVPSYKAQTLHDPIISVASLTEGGTALVEDTDFEIEEQDLAAGQIIRISGANADPIAWSTAPRTIKLTYEHGYVTVPEGIAAAATALAAKDYEDSEPSGKMRAGLRSRTMATGEDVTFLTRAEVWKEQESRLSPYRRLVV